MRQRYFLNFIAIYLIALIWNVFAWADDTYLKYDEVQWTQKNPGYLDVIDTLDSFNAISKYENSKSEFSTFDFRESTYHISKLRKAKTTLVFIHGLYGGAKQFGEFFKSMQRQGSDANGILLTLPGHYRNGNIDRPIKEATKEDWIEAVQNTIKIAKSLSEKVVIVGQSTGGLLAVYSAINFQTMVDGIILLEPALKVQTRIDIATCIGKHFVKDASSLSFFAKLIGMDAPKGISVSMGCEVAKLAEQILDRKYIEPNSYHESQEMKQERLDVAMSRLAEKIRLPVLMINNFFDHVVDPHYNELFASLLKNKTYIKINLDGKTEHGSRQTVNTDYSKDSFYEHTCNFLFENFAEQNCARNYFSTKVFHYFTQVLFCRSDSQIKESLKQIENDVVSESVCKFFENKFTNEQYCARFKEAIKMHIKFWLSVWQAYQVNQNGFSNLDSFFEAYRKKFSSDYPSESKKMNEDFIFFKDLFEGTTFYDLEHIYREKYSVFQKRLEIVQNLEKNKEELGTKCTLLNKYFNNVERNFDIARDLSKEITNVSFSEIYDTLRLIGNCDQIDKEIMAQKAYLVLLQDYLKRVYAEKNQRTHDQDELEFIMKNYFDLKDDSSFRVLDMQKVNLVISYLLQISSRYDVH